MVKVWIFDFVFHSIAFYFQPTEREIQVMEIRSLKRGIEER
jgi:hypothetical protein